MKDFSGWTVRYGFLDGNLPDGVNIKLWVELLEAALQQMFPGSTVEIPHQNASGSPPCGFSAKVYRDSDGEELRGGYDVIHYVVENTELPFLEEK